MTEPIASATLRRRRQRRPDFQSSSDVPMDLQQSLEHVTNTLLATVPSTASAAKVVRVTGAALQELLQPSLTPEQQLHAVSKITGAIREIPKFQVAAVLTEPTGELYMWGRTLALEVVVPVLLDCRVRYLHRAFMTVLRTVLPSPDAAAEAAVREMFLARVVHCSKSSTGSTEAKTGPTVSLNVNSEASEAAAALYFRSDTEDQSGTITGEHSSGDCSAVHDRVLSFLNAVDGLTSTLMPMMPGIFKETFLEVLPSLTDSLQWVVVSATTHSRIQARGATSASCDIETPSPYSASAAPSPRSEDEDVSGNVMATVSPASKRCETGSVFGEDLEQIRFCVRVVATYIHKYMNSLTLAMASDAASGDVRRELARLLQPTIVMLHSPIFPKDVLNAVGLLVASILTVRTCDAWLLSFVCGALCDGVFHHTGAAASLCGAGVLPNSVAEAKKERLPAALPLAHLFAQADMALRIVAAAKPREAAEANNCAGATALHDVFSHLTPNGCFALLKGILAHTSSPVHDDWMSLGLLMTPQPWFFLSSTAEATTSASDCHSIVVVYDIILPTAQRYCNIVQEPETRFMAIQTVDSIVRHVRAVLANALKVLSQPRESSSTAAFTEQTSHLSSSALAESGADPAASLHSHLSSLFRVSPKLQNTLSYATQLIMALWDDGTQQVSGALYSTYGEILTTQALLRSGAYHVSGERLECSIDTSLTLNQILHAPADRRGKYHALQGLLSMMVLKDFVSVLQQHYDCPSSAAHSVSAFACSLLAVASNHKIANVAGDVFAKLACSIAKASLDTAVSGCIFGGEAADFVMLRGIIEPLARAITERGYVGVSSNVSESVNLSHITAHFVAPFVKQEPTCLSAILTAITGHPVGAFGGELSSPPPCSLHVPGSERVEQGVVEVVARARGVGVDITPYLAPGTTVLRVLEGGCHSLNYEVRNAALGLCVLGVKRIQAVQPWQLCQLEEYLIFNMHLGGDTTARKGLLETMKKWVRRLMESYASKPQCSTSPASPVTSASEQKKSRREEEVSTVSQDGGSALPVAKPTGETDVPWVLGTPAYRVAVMDHCRRLSSIFAQNIGTSVPAGAGLAVERRVTAMMGYSILLTGLRTHLARVDAMEWTVATAPVKGGAAVPLLQVSVVPSLLALLSDGWSQARESAKDLLRIFCELAPTAVFAASHGAKGCGAVSGSAMAVRAYHDLLRAQTFRNAEGAVGRFLFFTTLTAGAQALVRQHPLQELERLSGVLERECVSVENKCAEMSALRGTRAYAYIQANPLHGSLSLCAELLTFMASVESHAATAAPSSLLTLACTKLLKCCCFVLSTHNSLVGTEAVAAGVTASLEEDEAVDCRGHVYDRNRLEAESVMRSVVNNTWLSMRLASNTITRILKVCPVHAIPFAVVHKSAYELVHTLLLTKHNGVMRCVREALKALAATLVRSRQPLFYQLPAELLDYLMGPEGVTSEDVARMLRRSQGLPHAILAILEVEDTTVPYCLFPSAMQRLLSVARGNISKGDDPDGSAPAHLNFPGEAVRRSQRSNALNVMKFIFEDKVFADRIVAYIEPAFSLATEGFHDASWYTRNSSLMLFSAVIHRFVGEHPSTGGSGVNTSLYDVAKRTPRGVAYAYAELTRGGQGVSQETAGGDSDAASIARINVALFPVLQLLSMLSPDPPHLITKVGHGESDDAVRMAEAVMQCSNSPSLMVRSASAVALCCLVPPSSLEGAIAQTRRGLLLEPPQLQGRVAESANHTVSLIKRGGTIGGGLNSCHGALLQLLQYHAQYVGTLRRHYKQKRSSYATQTLAETVSRAVSEVLLSCQHVLVRACAVSATVAASLFALLADIVFYGPRHKLSFDQQHALRSMCVEAMGASLKAHHVIPERGSLMEGASAVLVFLAAQQESTPIGRWSHEEQKQLAELLHREASVLSIRRGEHNLISWVIAQLQYYSDTAAVLTKTDVAVVLQAIYRDLHCDVSQLALQSLMEEFGDPESVSRSVTTTIGCVAWGQLVSHMRFSAMIMALMNEAVLAKSAAVYPSDFSILNTGRQVPPATALLTNSNVSAVSNCRAVAQLYATLVLFLTPRDDVDACSAKLTLWSNLDACSAALDFITTYDIYVSDAHAVSPPVARILSYYCEPEQPLESRLAVVKALRTAQLFLCSSCDAAASLAPSSCPPSAVTLLVILFRLLVDDAAGIREAAAVISSRSMWGAREAPRDQVSCLLAVVRLLRRLHRADLLAGTDALRSLLSLSDSPTTPLALMTAPLAEEAVDGDDVAESDDEDVLFRKEAANVFAETTVLSHLVSHILSSPTTVAAPVPVDFSVYDSFLV